LKIDNSCVLESAPPPHPEGQVACLESMANWDSISGRPMAAPVNNHV